MFRLKLFGSASIDGPAGRVTGRAVQRRRLGLLALLAVAGERGMTRDRLVGYLWPDSDGERARHLLSDSIYRINQAVGGEAVAAVGDDLRLNRERLPSDAWEFAEAMERGDWERAVELHVAPFLDGFFLTDADELERWVDGQRERLARERARALEALADSAERDGAMVDAVRWWRLLAAQDPWSSRIALRLMRVLDSAGERAAALQHAHVHTQLLEDEMGLAPDAELVAFVNELRTPPGPGSPAQAVAVRRAQTSVAVLPFVNLSTDAENEYFADGITEDVIASLSKIGALRVTARTSVMQFKGGEQSLREIGAALGASTLLHGSVRRVADRVRINAQLVCLETDEYLWAETYDRSLTDVFAIQADVALHIATALRATLSPEEKTRISREPTGNVEAYQLYLKGRHCFLRFTDDSMRQGITYFERATDLDQQYALAHASVAMVCAELGMTGHMDPVDAYRRAHASVARALELDADLAEAHCMRGQLLASGDYDWIGAERAFRRALELSPSSADTYDLYGRMCSALGRHDEGVALQKRAQELDPLAHRADFATALLRAGRYDEALDTAQQAVDFDPHYDRSRATLGWAHLMLGNIAEGLAELEAAVALSPASTAWLAQLGQAYGMTGRTSDACDILRRLDELSKDRYVSPYHMAYVYTGLGEHDKAVAALERAYRERAGAVYGIKGSFLFTTLHAHPGFKALLRRMNL
ncbi:MAG: tetratricopeptide repeat protein [Gemmatimonadetes bacterium]|nr:tetratricopeptide repeat protein [Gemmatimonadota bacterium]